jgi:hypothetical protein
MHCGNFQGTTVLLFFWTLDWMKKIRLLFFVQYFQEYREENGTIGRKGFINKIRKTNKKIIFCLGFKNTEMGLPNSV